MTAAVSHVSWEAAIVFSGANGRGPHGQVTPESGASQSEADSTLNLQGGGEARSPSVQDEGAAAGPGDGQESRSPSAALSLVHTSEIPSRRSWDRRQRQAYG